MNTQSANWIDYEFFKLARNPMLTRAVAFTRKLWVEAAIRKCLQLIEKRRASAKEMLPLLHRWAKERDVLATRVLGR